MPTFTLKSFFLFTFVPQSSFKPRNMQLKIFLSFLLFPYLVLFAANPVDTFVQNPLLENANISLLVKDLKTNETLYQYRPENLVTPASTMKLVTTATILELFGPEAGAHCRSAVGLAALPFNIPVEIEGEVELVVGSMSDPES